MFTKIDKGLLVENIRGASKKIKKAISEDKFEDIFQLMSYIHIPNGDLIVDALSQEKIKSYEDLNKRKNEFLIGILIHNITLSYVKLILQKSCMYFNENCTSLIGDYNGKPCSGIHKCNNFIQQFRVDYNKIKLDK